MPAGLFTFKMQKRSAPQGTLKKGLLRRHLRHANQNYSLSLKLE
jgi:hypothetical protein